MGGEKLTKEEYFEQCREMSEKAQGKSKEGEEK